MGPRLIVLGWDSATFDVAHPLMEAGRLPVLSSIAGGGFSAPLRSVWPPMTDCAWTSAFTGVTAAKHGIFGSWYRAPGAYECRYFSSRSRTFPAAWEMATEPSWLVWNVPMTFPPSEINGAMVAGYGAPPGAPISRPGRLQDEIVRRWPLDDLLDRAPHGTLEGFLDDLVRGLETQGEALPWAARHTGADCVLAVWPHVDRAQHFFWRYRDSDHRLSGAVDRVYEAMDAATGRVIEAFPEADVLVVSDHGAGPLHGDVNVGTWLTGNGFASYARPSRSVRRALSSVAWSMPPRMRRLGRRVAPGLARGAISARLAGQLAPFSWGETKAFFGVHSDLWINLRGREPEGFVEPEAAGEIAAEVAEGLLGLRDPDTGAALFAAAHRRDEVFRGPYAHLAPDVMLDSWSAGYRVAPGRSAGGGVVIRPAPLAGVDAAWSSDHRPLGVFAARGPHIAPGSAEGLSLMDVCPTTLALLGQVVPGGLDGRVVSEALSPGFLQSNPVRMDPAPRARATPASGSDATRPPGSDADPGYSDEEAAAVAEHLRDLGYIE